MQLAQTVSKKFGFVKTSDATRDDSSAHAPPPEWEEDQTCEDCCCCLAKFTVTRRKHHCRRCGRVVCGVCSGHKLPIADMGFSQPVRICVDCHCAMTALARGIDLQAVAEYVISECRPPLVTNRTASERWNAARVDQAKQELANLKLAIREHEMKLEKAHQEHQVVDMLDYAQQMNAMVQQIGVITEQLRTARSNLGQVVTGVVATEHAEFHDPRHQRYLVVTPGPEVIVAISGLNNKSQNKNACFKGGLRFMCAKTIDEVIKIRRCKIQVNAREQTPKMLPALHFQWEETPQPADEVESPRPPPSVAEIRTPTAPAPLVKSNSTMIVSKLGAPSVASTEFYITSEVSEKIRHRHTTGALAREDEVGKAMYELLQTSRKKYFDRIAGQKRIFEGLLALKTRQVAWTNEADASMLREMWKCLRSDPFPGTKSELWKDLGFQGTDPVTDFRGMGALTIHCLLYWARTHPQYATALIAQQHHRAYPICASAINICSLVADLTGMNSKSMPTSPLFLLFCRGNSLEPGTQFFEQVVCVCIALVDYFFVQSSCGYLDFPRVLANVREIVSSTANVNHVNFTEFMASLHDHFKDGADAKVMTPTWPKFTGPRVSMDVESKHSLFNSLSGSEMKTALSTSKDESDTNALTPTSTGFIDRSVLEDVSPSPGEASQVSQSGKPKAEPGPPRVSVYFDPPTPQATGMRRSPGALDLSFGYESVEYHDDPEG